MPEPTTTHQLTFTLSEIIGLLGGVSGFVVIVMGFFIKRSVFKEIDDLKQNKQNMNHCPQQLALCQKDFENVCGNIEGMKEGMKEGTKEFKSLHGKIDQILGALNIKITVINPNPH